jgi:hypothetical protein
MNKRLPTIVWVLVGVLSCGALWAAKLDAFRFLILEQGRLGIPPDLLMVLAAALFSTALNCALFFLILSWCASKVGWKNSLFRGLAFVAASLVLALTSVARGRPPYKVWTDGYAKRASAVLKEKEVLQWADSNFGNSNLIPFGPSSDYKITVPGKPPLHLPIFLRITSGGRNASRDEQRTGLHPLRSGRRLWTLVARDLQHEFNPFPGPDRER